MIKKSNKLHTYSNTFIQQGSTEIDTYITTNSLHNELAKEIKNCKNTKDDLIKLYNSSDPQKRKLNLNEYPTKCQKYQRESVAYSKYILTLMIWIYKMIVREIPYNTYVNYIKNVKNLLDSCNDVISNIEKEIGRTVFIESTKFLLWEIKYISIISYSEKTLKFAEDVYTKNTKVVENFSNSINKEIIRIRIKHDETRAQLDAALKELRQLIASIKRKSYHVLTLKNDIIDNPFQYIHEEISNTFNQIRSNHSCLKCNMDNYKEDRKKLQQHKENIINRKNNFLNNLHKNYKDLSVGQNTYKVFSEYENTILNKVQYLLHNFGNNNKTTMETLNEKKMNWYHIKIDIDNLNTIYQTKNKKLDDLIKEHNEIFILTDKFIAEKSKEINEEAKNIIKLILLNSSKVIINSLLKNIKDTEEYKKQAKIGFEKANNLIKDVKILLDGVNIYKNNIKTILDDEQIDKYVNEIKNIQVEQNLSTVNNTEKKIQSILTTVNDSISSTPKIIATTGVNAFEETKKKEIICIGQLNRTKGTKQLMHDKQNKMDGIKPTIVNIEKELQKQKFMKMEFCKKI
ncbi:uncharacterized protein MKS88_000307 [Plasmodium brasilianum]|uniref:uncharacterized protein n=1 Tax=Plasmodium brasilianum TaxID=5824 RepID=UPI00350E49B5|nr:hypothetical protein MKS88_000307 [Plasmodium brasilianum]